MRAVQRNFRLSETRNVEQYPQCMAQPQTTPDIYHPDGITMTTVKTMVPHENRVVVWCLKRVVSKGQEFSRLNHMHLEVQTIFHCREGAFLGVGWSWFNRASNTDCCKSNSLKSV